MTAGDRAETPAGEGTSATLLDKPRKPAEPSTSPSAAAAAAASSEPPSVSDSSLITPEQAMVHDEALRLRAFAGALVPLCVLGVGLLLVLGGDPLARRLHLAAVAATGAYAGGYYLVARDPARFRAGAAAWIAYIAIVANGTGFYYWGIFSPYVALVPVSAYVFSTGGSGARFWWVTLGVTVISHLGLGIAIIAGAIADVGLFRAASSAGTLEQTALLATIDLVIIGSVALGRRNRTMTRAVLDEHHAAVRALAQRDALLAEAHAEIREVQAAVGRFTGHAVGTFVLENVLGRGAMGEVYAATGADGTRVAIKLLAPGRLRDPAAHRRFEREVRLVAQLASPNIVRVIEVSPPDAALPYLAMERLEGVELAALIKETPVRPLAEVVEIVRQVAAGLDAAHAAGIVHRDLKPQNVFAAGPAAAPTWKVLDFGISKLVDDGGTLTRDHIVGTPGYMAPEQARNEPIDARTDVYALGILTYRLLTGMPAVLPAEPHSMLYEVVYRMPPRPTTLVELPAAVEAVLAIAIAKPPGQRFGSAGEFATALAAAAAGTLPAAIAARADTVLARTPWGHWLRRGRDRRPTAGL